MPVGWSTINVLPANLAGAVPVAVEEIAAINFPGYLLTDGVDKAEITAAGDVQVTLDGEAVVLGAGAAVIGAVTQSGAWGVTVIASALPAGAATEATLATLATEATLATLDGKVVVCDTGNVTVVNAAGAGVYVRPGTGAVFDVDTELPAAAALDDATANPTTPLAGAALMAWDPVNLVWRRVPFDGMTNALRVIDYAHHELHSGSHFTWGVTSGDLDDGGTMEFILTTADTAAWPHLLISVTGALDTTVEFFEDTTHTAGAAETSFDNNRNTANTAGMDINVSNDDGADGTLLLPERFGIDAGGGANRTASGGQARSEAEWDLRQNAKYLLKVTSNTDNNVVSIKLSWYEHTSLA
jgi:hypothetical protein